MQPTLPGDAIGRALQGLLPDGHPYRTLVEETLATRRRAVPCRAAIPPNRSRWARRRGRQAADVKRPTRINHDARHRRHDGELVGVLLVARNLAHLSRMQSTLAYSRKLVALGRLTAGIAHEVKNPLNAMMIHLELLRTKIRATSAAVAA